MISRAQSVSFSQVRRIGIDAVIHSCFARSICDQLRIEQVEAQKADDIAST